ncbi:bifunctional 23S rRNA (guanine(2069)-N(7))-methyltransferase RlmK/23S rRNA (guanine(2445)-N(2))-methyltransferase RlmL [Vibrio crassostreae]|uniref:bifunctional 23S rRNA (guanine(2069)-N(7))-methyltransferase RlmK/23S rRNA (guanine(2445)-N(2))-methyltransferase RlmL n=1 Tax=Vibrio crassostreae TaxID=246167 RepID=UPI000F4AEDA3|nr:bifunctional 23S rRNA (guanine(2069)-N(7))-methyltransferase RlmK/23S rRNA (guanine(2445)-N(2))-methyltransferase RlmL [Vibrio crassostreae]ROS70439.1 23S rRNA m(2)G-2445 methyltransferase [Vibrio crassostreae]TCT44141.1 23S rRNA m(2)G-2445 methyltransferase [Vibrio crassostreae]TCV60591.1 23S rRNA m(2)G-2445 methyltransferase [Vibrio crassostreae]TCW22149.1 23S rRNA m(2)G-2445 methyltransferase [Vibrio crassostreae]CAK2687856.1 fused 23S rRNA m(2)G2445 methyltransferase and 23S rRNA m(7)G2
MNQYLAVTSNGLENLLVEELTQLGITNAKPVQAGVKFKATNEQIYRCCLWSRLASRFVRVLSEFTCMDDMDLYLSTTAVNWVNQFHSSKRFVVDFNGTNNEIRNSQYGAMKVKDAVVDCFEKKSLPRPSISKENPDVRIHVRLHRDKAILGVDMVGSGLHQRGYRPESGRAPLRETLAAAILLRSGWDATKPFLDPMCGSGTLVIEAAMMAANMAPGVKRQKWCFESLEDFEPELWAEVKAEANVQGRRGVKKVECKFYGYDNDERMIKTARDNARRAGVEELIEFEVGDAAKLKRPTEFADGVIVSNPPYGERLGTEPGLIALYTAFGAQLKAEFGGCNASIFSSSDELLSCLRMRADKQFKLNNGALPCYQKNYSISDRPMSERPTGEQEQLIAPDFANRLKKNIGKIGKWAKKEQLDCYRIYDADLPEYNVAIDVYPGHLVIQEYAAPKDVPEDKAKRRLTDIIRASIQVTGVEANNVVLKVRQKQKGRSQYQKMAQDSSNLEVNEYGVKLIVNLHDYLDTGLFLDHKITRRRIGEMAAGKDFLNLFAYTGSASVHAAVGGARSTTTVDMSNTYLEWAKQNMELNGRVGRQHQFVQADCLQWLVKEQGSYDLIFIDPPTFSNSKRMDQSFDVQRDHIQLMENLKRLLREEGTIVFSNNKRHFKMDLEALDELGLKAQNISAKTLPLDFSRNKHIHNCWLITHK